MAGLHVKYTQEIADCLGKLAVFEPGREVEPGDIVYFPEGRRRRLLGRFLPRGTFQRVGAVKELTDEPMLIGPVSHAYKGRTLCYRALSMRGASYSLDMSGRAKATAAASKGSGRMTVQFDAAGTTCLTVIGCAEVGIKDVAQLACTLSPHQVPSYAGVFVVSSVVRAKRAVIVQAAKAGAQLTMSGNVNVLNLPAGPSGLDGNASAGLSLESVSAASFTADWSEDDRGRPVFMELLRIERHVGGVDLPPQAVNAPTGAQAMTCVVSRVEAADLIG